MIFLEIKTDIGKVSDLQRYRITELGKYGTEAYMLRGWDGFIDFQKMIQ